MTLTKQVTDEVLRRGLHLGFDEESAKSCARTAVEICESDEVVDRQTLNAVLREVMRVEE